MAQITYNDFILRSFHGLYDTVWSYNTLYDSPTDELAMTLQQLGLGTDLTEETLEELLESNAIDALDYLDNDLVRYCMELSTSYANGWQGEINDALNSMGADCSIVEISGTKIVSPREYNFTSDDLYAVVTLSENFIPNLLEVVGDKYAERIRNEYTTRDGFRSFTSNDWSEWKNTLLSDPESEKSELYLEILLTYILEDYNTDAEYNIAEHVQSYDGVYPDMFLQVQEGAKERFDKDVAELLKDK